MKTQLQYYDWYPKVTAVGRPARITIHPLGAQAAFPMEMLELRVCPLQGRAYPLDERPCAESSYHVAPNQRGELCFTHTCDGEQEYFIRVYHGEQCLCQLSIYALKADLAGLIPLMGDQHVHTIRSDGHEGPALVAANLRKEGYDYMAITDHANFSGSLEAMAAYRDVPLDMCMLTGEEVHLPDCPIHVVHMGGRYSVNALIEDNQQFVESKHPGVTRDNPWNWRAAPGCEYPESMSAEAFHQTVWNYAESLNIPQTLPRFTIAGFSWICQQIRKAGGVSIFAHPYWIENMFHADERVTQFLFERNDFDAFEVLGGEAYYEQNGLQTGHYYQARAEGLRFPIVGSSDSHGTVNNPNAFLAKTITFAKSNTPQDLLDAIRAGHTVAVDSISKEYRLVGEYRLMKYACFLMENYFPLHQEACWEQGRAMKEYACGDREEGLKMLKALDGRVSRLQAKSFGLDQA